MAKPANLSANHLDAAFLLQQENFLTSTKIVFLCELLRNAKAEALSPGRQGSLVKLELPEFFSDLMQLIHVKPGFTARRTLKVFMLNILRRQTQ